MTREIERMDERMYLDEANEDKLDEDAEYDAQRAGFVCPDTGHALHARIAELEREGDELRAALLTLTEQNAMAVVLWNELKQAGYDADTAPKLIASITALRNELDAANERAEQGLTLVTLCDMVLGEDAADRSDTALVRAVGEMKRERDAIGAVLASQSRNAVISGGTPTLTERAANNRIAELERDNANQAKQIDDLREMVAKLELWKRRANTQMEITRAAMEIVNAPFQVYDGRTGLRGYRISVAEFENLENAVGQYMDAANAQETGGASRARDETPPAT